MTTNPWFDNLELKYQGAKHTIICNTKLAGSFTETLDDVLLSGENITLHFQFELYAVGGSDALQRKEIVNGFRFDESREIYFLANSEDKKLEKYFTMEAAKDTYITVRNLSVVNTSNLSADQDYFVKVTAYLDPIKLDNMSESVNLMLRWASVKPTIVSEKFRIKPRAT